MLVPPRGDVLDILYQDSKFSRLVATLKEIGMAEELQTTASDITLFAPTNEVSVLWVYSVSVCILLDT